MVRIEVVLRRIAMLGLLVPIGCSAQVGPRPDSVERASRVQALENENATLRIRLEDAERALAGGREFFFFVGSNIGNSKKKYRKNQI